LARTLPGKDLEREVARALEHRNGLGDADNLTLTFDRDVQTLQLDAANSGAVQVAAQKYDPRSGRFDVAFEIASDSGAAPARLRFTGIAIETLEAAVLARNVERNEVLKSSDVIIERRPKAEVGGDAAGREAAIGMQVRRQLRAGSALRTADLAKPDLVTRDQSVTLIYEAAGLYLTVRGKAMEAGTQGDVVNVINLQSKRTVAGTVVGRGQVSVASIPAPRLSANAAEPAPAANNTASVPQKAE
jgi:flagella basal body P-ring formation protein FlgA